MNVSVILPAAGLGTRMGREKSGTSRKQFMLLDGEPILLHTIRKFTHCPSVSEIVVALRAEDLDWGRGLIHQQHLTKPIRFVEGGDSRQQSVENALASLAPDTGLVAVHDAVRPFADPELVEKVIAEAAHTGGAIPGIVPVDTVKRVHKNKIRDTLPRENLVLAQTPQVFRFDLLKRAFESARRDGRWPLVTNRAGLSDAELCAWAVRRYKTHGRIERDQHLLKGPLRAAREQVSRIVGRDTPSTAIARMWIVCTPGTIQLTL